MPDALLHWEAGDDGAIICPVTNLLQFLRDLIDPRLSSAEALRSASPSLPPPDLVVIRSFLAFPHALATAVAADAAFFALDQGTISHATRAGFISLEPVLRGLRADLDSTPAGTAAADWLDRIGWMGLIAIAGGRDLAAKAILAGFADLSDGCVELRDAR